MTATNPPRHAAPRSITEQFVRFAESGHLEDLDPSVRADHEDRAPAVKLMVASSLAVGVGLTLALLGVVDASARAIVAGLGVFAIAFAYLLIGLREVLQHVPRGGIDIRPGAVLPPTSVSPGNWLLSENGWARVEQLGRSGDGTTMALLSNGEVVDLARPVTVAGGDFRPITLRRGH